MSHIKCPNYEICERNLFIVNDETEVVEGNLDNHVVIKLNKPNPVCWECGSFYSDVENEHQNKYLSFIDSMECSICFKTDRGVSFPNCLHYTCIPCHKRCFFGPDPVEPEFPYCNDIKRLYLSDQCNSIWLNDPKIKEYKLKDNKLEVDRMDQWERETNLRKCPLCRS